MPRCATGWRRRGERGCVLGRALTDPQQSVAALSRTATESRLAEDCAVFDFSLDGAAMDTIHALARLDARIVNPGIGRRGGIGALILA